MYNESDRSKNSRPLKIGEAIRHALSDILLRGETHIPALDGISITVSEVRVAPDLKNANAYVMPLGGHRKEEILKMLIDHAPHLRALLARRIDLRYMPKIWYKLDESYEEAHKINQLLSSVIAKSPEGDEDNKT